MSSCDKKVDVRAMDWLIGEWDYIDFLPASFETWQVDQNGVMCGNGFSVIGEEQILVEDMTISMGAQGMVFTLLLGDEGSVVLPLEHCSADSVVFANDAVDFPKRLTYIKLSNTIRRTQLSGLIENKQTDMSFDLQKR